MDWSNSDGHRGGHWTAAVDDAAGNDAARPVPEDYGLAPTDLRIWYSPGRAGSLLAVLATAGMAGVEALDGIRSVDPWPLGLLEGLLYGGLIGGFAGLGLLVLVHWCDPLVGWSWPVYARLRRYRDALAAARDAERHGGA